MLLPGLGRPAEDLDPFAAVLVAAGYKVVQPDPRGSGGSTGPLDGLTLHDLAGDIAAVIEVVGGAPVVLIGHAFGNRIARTVATDRPDLVRALVLLSASGKVQPTPEIAEAIRLAQAVDTPPAVRARAVRAAWFAPGHDISMAWVDGWSQPVMRRISRRRRRDQCGGLVDRPGSANVLIVQGLVRRQRADRERAAAARGNRRARDVGGARGDWPRGAGRRPRGGGETRFGLPSSPLGLASPGSRIWATLARNSPRRWTCARSH